jgi:preprotein translocase subunit SecA
MSVVSVLQSFMGDPTQKKVKAIMPVVDKINSFEEKLQNLSDEELQAKTQEFKDRIANGETTEELLPEAFAVVKNACRRLVGKSFEINGKEREWVEVPYDVQLLGGAILHSKRIAEMKTGEGKTLVAALPVYLEALSGKGVHVITVNDYLAKRDSEWLTPMYAFLGMSVGVIVHGITQQERKDAYRADITYGTNNEFGFDYLRDNMATNPNDIVQRDLHFCIVDEVDSILIDEARTPLIISAPAEESTSKYKKYGMLVHQLQKDVHYIVDEKRKTAVLNEEGIKKMEELMGVENIYTDAGFAEVHHIEQALKAIAVFQKDTDYVVKDGEVIIVDEFTGRLMPGRRFSDGLHQALEAKEKVEIKRESKTLATITFQNYFRLYSRLAGMTGTAKTEEEEFLKIYGLEVAVIPTNKDITRKDLNDLVYKNERGKFQAIAKKTKEKHQQGQPVLIGTISIERSELLSAMLQKEGVPHEVLNAKNHAREAQIVANAGQMGAVTIATNMAGRGTDIKLGQGVAEVGGLCIIGSERHESRRIDNQLRGRAGRQGDPGETQFFVSLEDSLMRLFGSDRLQKMMDTLRIPDDMPIENKMISGSIESAQKKVEGHHFDMRKHVVQYDDVMNRQREIIYKRRRKILEEADIHEEFLKWIDEEVDFLANLHIRGREPHKYELKEFAEGISVLHKDGAPTQKELEEIEVEDRIIQRAKEFLLDQFGEREKALPDPKYFREAERAVTLRVIDQFWMDHIDEMQHLREQVALVGYAQKNPLHEYQSQGYEKFKALLKKIQNQAIRTMFQININIRFGDEMPVQRPTRIRTNAEEIAEALTAEDTVERAGTHRVRASVSSSEKGQEVSFTPTPNTQRIRAEADSPSTPAAGRNEPCPCGSGKKYKKCCGRA